MSGWPCKVVVFNGTPKGIMVEQANLIYFEGCFFDHAIEYVHVAKQQPSNPKDDGFCYNHARELALSEPNEYRYVDGLAGVSEGFHQVGETYCECFSCVPHAWCVNLAGEVEDPTWDAKDGRYYLGVPIPMDVVEAHQADRISPEPKAKSPVLCLDHVAGHKYGSL